jgi:putative transcriptional regulator
MRIAPASRGNAAHAPIDWQKVDATSDADIARQAAADADTAQVVAAAELLAAARRIEPDAVEDVLALRTRFGLSQDAFARRFGFSVDAVRQYESHRRTPTGPARTLLRMIAREPDAVTRALNGTR